jgi:hypothetical protein
MCFIATAAYGSPMASEVVVLSQFRDRILLRSKLGTAVVQLYYAVSPPLASCIDRKEPLKAAIRLLLLPMWLRHGSTETDEDFDVRLSFSMQFLPPGRCCVGMELAARRRNCRASAVLGPVLPLIICDGPRDAAGINGETSGKGRVTLNGSFGWRGARSGVFAGQGNSTAAKGYRKSMSLLGGHLSLPSPNLP